MLYAFACEVPNPIAYPLFKTAIINLTNSQDDHLKRKAGLRILGHICDSDALLDPIKDEVDLYTDILVRNLSD